MKHPKLDARTMITWGTPPEEVVQFLVNEGIGMADAQTIVSELQDERNNLLARRGYRRIFIGSITCIVSAILFWAVMAGAGFVGEIRSHRTLGLLITSSVIGFFWGLWKAMDGVRDLARPETVHDNLGLKHSDLL